MVNSGASFKAVADVLGHKSIATTLIYAKLDMKSLREVALPWSRGAWQCAQLTWRTSLRTSKDALAGKEQSDKSSRNKKRTIRLES